MNEAKIKMNYAQKITLFLLFLAGMNFLNGYFYFMFISTACFLLYRRTIEVDRNVIFIALVALALMVFSPASHDRITSIMKPTIYLLAYMAGMNFLPVRSKYSNGSLLYLFCKVTIMIALAPLLHFLINMVINLRFDLNRSTIDVWTGTALSATNQAALTCLAVGAFISILFIDCSKRKKLLAALALLILLLYNFTLAGRTLFVLATIVFVLSALFYFWKQKEIKKKTRLLLYVLLGISAIVIIYENNLFGVQDKLGETNFFLRFFGEYSYSNITQDSRINSKLYFLKNFLDGFLGGAHIRESGIGYAHDIILDTYDEAGIIALIGIIFFLVSVYYTCIRFVRRESVPLYARQIIVGIYSAVLLEFMIEPIIQGSPWLFALFCFISGMFIRISKLDFSKSGDGLRYTS